MEILKLISILIFLVIITISLIAIFNAFGVSTAIYGSYLVWVWVLVLFYLLLPSANKSALV